LEVQRAKDAFTGHLRETDKLKNTNESLTKKVDKYEDKLEAFRSVKIDGWEDADTELARKIKSNTARISQLHKMLKEGYEDGDPQQDLMAGLAPAPNINIEQPASGLAQDFGRSINGVV